MRPLSCCVRPEWLARHNAVVLVAAFGVLGWASELGAELYAERITAESLASRRVGGVDAIAGVGDWALGNGTLCAAVADPSHESALSERGGVLVDLGHCGENDDQWGVLQPMLNLSRENVVPVSQVEAELDMDAGRATLVTRGVMKGVRVESRYVLDLEQPDRLQIITTLERLEDGEAIFLFGDVVLHGHRQLSPFTLSTDTPSLSVGFRHPAIDVNNPLAMARAIVRADLQVLVGGAELEPGISYGFRLVEARRERANGERAALAHLGLNGEHFSILAAYTDTLWVGGKSKPGLIELAQTLLMDLEVGDRVVYEREIIVSRRADVASITNRVWSDGPLVRGHVDDAAARLHVRRADGVPITFARPDSNGNFELRLPPTQRTRYEIEAVASAGRAVRTFVAAEAVTDLGEIAVGSPAVLVLPRGEPMRLVFEGILPTPSPRLGTDHYSFFVGDERIPSSTEAASLSLAGVAGDLERIELPPGHYRVFATRGPEWSVFQKKIEMVSGRVTPLEIEPPLRVLEPQGWVSADLHVHSALSDDSSLPLRRRIAAFAAQSADVIVATEHDRVVDYGPEIRALGLAGRIASVVGVEVTSTVRGDVTPFTIGHANAFPVRLRESVYRGGAPLSQNRRLRSVVAEVRQLANDPVGAPGERPILQLNHPREAGVDGGLGAYLGHLGVVGEPMDPVRPLSEPPNAALIERDPVTGLRDLDFDVIELLNGPSMLRYRLVRADWFSLLLQGEIRTATANSDSHTAHDVVAMPRNYVAYAGARGLALDERAFISAVRAGHLYGSTGPLLEVELGGRGPGERFRGRSGELTIAVRSAGWVPVDEVRVYLDGALYQRVKLREQRDLKLAMRFDADAFITVEVEGTPGDVYASIAPGFTPFAFTNPIFVDHDADGEWTPPGLPRVPPATLSNPAEAP